MGDKDDARCVSDSYGRSSFVSQEHLDRFFHRPPAFKDSATWIAAYDGKRYPVSATTAPTYELNGYRATVSVGCFVFQLVVADDLARARAVVPPPDIGKFMTPLRPLTNGDIRWRPLIMSDADLRALFGIDDHSWNP